MSRFIFDKYTDKFWGYENLKSVSGCALKILAFENSREGEKMLP